MQNTKFRKHDPCCVCGLLFRKDLHMSCCSCCPCITSHTHCSRVAAPSLKEKQPSLTQRLSCSAHAYTYTYTRSQVVNCKEHITYFHSSLVPLQFSTSAAGCPETVALSSEICPKPNLFLDVSITDESMWSSLYKILHKLDPFLA